jgi:outer membrane immunogenic protein
LYLVFSKAVRLAATRFPDSLAVKTPSMKDFSLNKLIFFPLIAALPTAMVHAQSDSNFAGAKVGIVAGYDNVTVDLAGESDSDDGFLYGINASYDFDLGSVIAGIEAEWTDSSTKTTASDLLLIGDSGSLTSGRDLYAGVRLGVPISSDWMVYAKGGYTNAKASLNYNDGAGTLVSGSDELDGFRVGGGFEYSKGQIFGRVEYRYSDYGEYVFQGIPTGLETSRHHGAVVGGIRF